MIGFDSLSYAVNTKNEPDVPIIDFHSVPDYYDRDMFFPIGVIVLEGAEGDTAIGKSCMNCMQYYQCLGMRQVVSYVYVLNRDHTNNQTRLGIGLILYIFKFYNYDDYKQLLLH